MKGERIFKVMVEGWGTFIYTESEIEHDDFKLWAMEPFDKAIKAAEQALRKLDK